MNSTNKPLAKTEKEVATVNPGRTEIQRLRSRAKLYDRMLGVLCEYGATEDPTLTLSQAMDWMQDFPVFLAKFNISFSGIDSRRCVHALSGHQARSNNERNL